MSAAVAAVLAAGFLVLMVAVDRQRDAGRIALRAEQAIAAGRALETTAINLDNGVRSFIVTGKRQSLQPFISARRAYPTRLAALRRLTSGSASENRHLDEIDQQIADYIDLWGTPLISVAGERLETARSVMRNTIGRDRIDDLRREFRALFDDERAIANARQQRAESGSDRAMVLGGAGIALVLAVCLGLWLYLRRSIVRPVESLADATQAVAAGDLSTRVPVDRADEIGTLSAGFNAMTVEMERSNRDLQDFAAIASHDLKSPLITISRLAELLCARVEDDRQLAEIAGHISTSTARLHDLVNDLLAYAKVGQGELDPRPVALDDVVQTALDNLEAPIDQAGAEVRAQRPLPAVQGDQVRLTQLVQNLVGNAVKFANGEPQVVRISSITHDGQCRLTVADNGIGFEPDQAERIFRPFHRLHALDSYEGSGLGLAVCARIVAQHGGRIWAEGRKGEGATFHVELPLADR